MDLLLPGLKNKVLERVVCLHNPLLLLRSEYRKYSGEEQRLAAYSVHSFSGVEGAEGGGGGGEGSLEAGSDGQGREEVGRMVHSSVTSSVWSMIG